MSAAIRDEILGSKEQAIPFVRFMELALYHPELGYYMTPQPKVGKDGDFFTSGTLHPVFAEVLADLFVQMWKENGIDQPVLAELGGGTGYLMKHLLSVLFARYPEWYQRLRLVLVEGSPYHRQLQQQALQPFQLPQVWYRSVEEAARAQAFEGIVLSNEYFDAFPVHLMEKLEEGWCEAWVTWEEQEQRFRQQFWPRISVPMQQFLADREPIVPVGTRLEVNLGMRGAVRAIGSMIKRGYVLTIDYGDREEELYHSSRKAGTLLCYYRHRVHTDPFRHIGEQDITAHVNFSALEQWGEEAGLRCLAFLRQDQFLLQAGILQKAIAHQDRDPFRSSAMKQNWAIQQLIDPAGLGGRFRVMLQGKEVERLPHPLCGNNRTNKKDAR
nr:SAM-dependent methyltransferase [Brevibacillus fulvus]